MKKLLFVLMLVLSVVSFANKLVISVGSDNVRDDAHPDTFVLMDLKTNKYTLVKITDSPHGGLMGVGVGDVLDNSIFKQRIFGFDERHPEGYDTGVKAAVYLKYKGRTYKEIDYNTLLKVLKSIGYRQFEGNL